jgi:hypothetical protein
MTQLFDCGECATGCYGRCMKAIVAEMDATVAPVVAQVQQRLQFDEDHKEERQLTIKVGRLERKVTHLKHLVSKARTLNDHYKAVLNVNPMIEHRFDKYLEMKAERERVRGLETRVKEQAALIELLQKEKALKPDAEMIQWRNIRKVVKGLADLCFGSQDDPRWGVAHLAIVNSLSAKDGLDISTLKLEPLSK